MINPLTGLEEEEIVGPPKPDVQDYIMKKFNLGPYTNDARQKLVDDQEIDFGDKAGAALAALGAGISGGNASAAGQAKLEAAANRNAKKLDAFDKGRNNLVQEHSLDRQLTKESREDRDDAKAQEKLKREQDPKSEESILAQSLAKKMVPGRDFSGMTAEQINGYIPSLSKIYDIEQKKIDRAEAREQRTFEKEKARSEKEQGLKTPFGLANTEDDAKKLKEAFESKKNFDSKIQEMIDLRKSKGVEYLDREAVSRGKQLSKDLLLEYKNMAKLGVLSQADENIINAIIPADPLGQDWMPGQDSILSNLEKFKKDSDNDFKTKVATRTRAGVEGAAKPTIVKTQTNKKTGEKRAIYSDGTSRVINQKVAGGASGGF